MCRKITTEKFCCADFTLLAVFEENAAFTLDVFLSYFTASYAGSVQNFVLKQGVNQCTSLYLVYDSLTLAHCTCLYLSHSDSI
ncbi:hypothetical protein DdX_10038 [Ditylenchus destructor]|uniref:Uncharacterized protein n=1 Tax=Ditylenchus destructor TaxID=166010 RepID=A0AAD4N4S2_9BILA|nr:hypothetical protein DdX_10038 [Ditylenchus destructor]